MSELVRIKLWKTVLRNMKESPVLKEETIRKEAELSKTNQNVKILLDHLYLEEDRKLSFQRYCNSQEFKKVYNEIARHVECNWNAKICEIGAGPGFLAVALAKSGFNNVSILEPNNAWITGTGFIADSAHKYGVHVWNTLDDWYASDEFYDLIITKACVHHFDNISKVAAEIRCKISGNGKWLMFDEYFVNSADELYSALVNHVHVVKYGQYEWPYSASLYVGLIQLVGYKLIEVLPNRYENNYIVRNISGNIKLTKVVTILSKILIKFKMTVFAFKIEDFICNGFITNKFRLFTAPQLLVFRLNKIVYPSVKAD